MVSRLMLNLREGVTANQFPPKSTTWRLTVGYTTLPTAKPEPGDFIDTVIGNLGEDVTYWDEEDGESRGTTDTWGPDGIEMERLSRSGKWRGYTIPTS